MPFLRGRLLPKDCSKDTHVPLWNAAQGGVGLLLPQPTHLYRNVLPPVPGRTLGRWSLSGKNALI
jgi:hypothetical protein